MKKVEIQKYVVQGEEHWRAREKGEQDFKFEKNHLENLNQFKWRIMDILNTGCIFFHLPDWEWDKHRMYA